MSTISCMESGTSPVLRRLSGNRDQRAIGVPKNRVARLLSVALITLAATVPLLAQAALYPFHPKDKKIIVFQGSDYFDWAPDVASNLVAMQTNRPYIDGLVFHTGPEYGVPNWAFNNEVWTETSLHFADLATIAANTTRFDENFILVWGHSRNVNPDFFNDALWTTIIANAQLMGKAVKAAGCKGIMFDPEFYSRGETYSPWYYTVPAGAVCVGTPPYAAAGKTFDQVKAKARERGRAYVQALQGNMPTITIMTTFLYGAAWDYCYGQITNQPASEFALLPAFADGMLEALNAGGVIVDGNEGSYYCNETRNYVEEDVNGANYTHVRLEATPAVCDPALLPKWNRQGQVAMAPYMDLCYNIYDPHPWNTHAYQGQWMKHNVYNSLLVADQYVWTYIESMNYWTGENAPAGVNVVADIEAAVAQFRSGNALGYDMYNRTYTGASSFITTPTVVITSPTNNTIVSTPGIITISATVTPATLINRVEFYANSLKIGTDRTAPYSITNFFLKADYAIVARVFKTNGKHTTSAPAILSGFQTISGTITNETAGLAHVIVSDGTRNAVTSSNGSYTIADVPDGSYTVTPAHSDFTFTPAARIVVVSNANVTGQDFDAYLVPEPTLIGLVSAAVLARRMRHRHAHYSRSKAERGQELTMKLEQTAILGACVPL